jgi:RNA polymerase sigma-70 factor (ECF subfamily)
MADDASRLSRDDVLARVRARILAFARARLSPDDAEDLTREALVLLTTKYAHVAPEELVAIGARIVAFERTALSRKATRRQAAAESPAGADDAPLDAPSEAPDPEEIAHKRQRVAMLVEAAGRLEGRCRQLLRRKLEGASFVEIAAELGSPVNTVYSWDHRCHKKLKDLLAERWAFVSGEAS